MALNEASERLPSVLSQGREVAEADRMEVERQQPLQRVHRQLGTGGDARGRRIEPPAKLVLQGIADDDYPLLRQVETNAAGRVARKMDDADLGGERYEVSVLEALVNGNRGAVQPGHGWPG